MTEPRHGQTPAAPVGGAVPSAPAAKKAPLGLFVALGAIALLLVGLVYGFVRTGAFDSRDEPLPEIPVEQAHVLDSGVCGRIDLSPFERFGVAEDPVESSANDGEMFDTLACDVTFADPEDPRGVGTLRISLIYYLRPDGAAGKLDEVPLGPELRPQPLPAGAWEQGSIGVGIDENGTTVNSAVVARHANLFADITWFWASGSPDLSANEEAVLATATSVFAVA